MRSALSFGMSGGLCRICRCAMAMALFVAVATSPAQNRTDAENVRASPDTVLQCPAGTAQLRDERFHSEVLGEERLYRVFLPANYGVVQTRYPVIYYLHGHSDRYTLEDYDHGQDTVPKICSYVAAHPVIVVAMDGYVAQNYTGFYGGDPYDIRRSGGRYDFGKYFLEQVRTVEARYRTLISRRYRALSGLSMGGFMSLYLSARYPGIVGSTSAFNPGPEFYVGPTGRRVLWRPKDHVPAYEHTPVRLVMASGDYISQYTKETRDAFAPVPEVDFEFRQDEYHRHWATSITETFDFHLRQFANPTLDRTPEEWSYDSVVGDFDVWGYHAHVELATAASVSLRHVSHAGFEVRTRRWTPDGPSASCTQLDLSTAPLYRPRDRYRIADFSLQDNSATVREAFADEQGRLHLTVGCSGHEIGISGPGVEPILPVLLPLTDADYLRILPGQPGNLPIRIWNSGSAPLRGVRLELTSEYPTVELLGRSAAIDELAPGQIADLSSSLQARFTAGDGDFSRVRIQLKLANTDSAPGAEKPASSIQHLDLYVAPSVLTAPTAVRILDGRSATLPIFWQGRQGGGKSVDRTVTEGKGNGNGILESGEQATVWVQTAQGLDPFDKGNWCRAKVYTFSPFLTEVDRFEEDKHLEWTSAQNLTSLVELAPGVSDGTSIKAILDCETYSYSFPPDMRYGHELLYQPYQRHRHQLYMWEWRVKR
jgi:pimeloyl-ACP methyl ester carboxylesterase